MTRLFGCSLSTTAVRLAALCLTGSLWAPNSVSAQPITDAYWGGDDHGRGDVIGSSSLFGVSGAKVSRSGTTLTVDVYTSFAGRADDGLFAAYTDDPFQTGRQTPGIGYGDLFLNTTWEPYGTGPHYIQDDHSTGTLWGYGFALDDRWASGGIGTLYALGGLSNDANTFLSEDFLTGATYRNGQEIAVDTVNNSFAVLGSGTWAAGSGLLRFDIDVSGAAPLLTSPGVALHWGPSCGNDTIEAYTSVPEPGSLMLLGLGLVIGIPWFARAV